MAAAGRMAGCYILALGPWSEPRAHGGRMPNPTYVDLHTTQHERSRPGFQLVATTPGFTMMRGSLGSPPAWSPVGSDSLQVLTWATGTSSVTLFLRQQPDRTLQGTARYFTDGVIVDPVTKRWLWEQYPTAQATLAPSPCTSGGSA